MRILLAVLLLPTPLVTAAPPSAEDYGRDLASPVYSKREAASGELWKLGAKARPVLEAVVKGDDTEASERALAILEKFDWGLFPDTPVRIAELLKKIRHGNNDEQVDGLGQLLQEGLSGAKAAQIVLQQNLPEDRRYNLISRVETSNARLVPEALFRGDTAQAEQLLLVGSLGSDHTGAMAYADFVAKQGRIPQALQALAEIRKKGGPAAQATDATQVLLLHWSGQKTECRKLLDERFKSDFDSTLFENILEEHGAWNDLADLGLRGRTNDAVTGIGINLMRERFAGRNAKADALWKDLAAQKLPPTATITTAYRTAAAWSFNGRPLAVMDHFKTMPAAQPILIDMLAGQMKFDELFALPPLTPQSSARLTARTQANVNLRRGRILALLGRHAEADAEFSSCLKHWADDRYTVRDLLRAEVRAGRWEQAAVHTAAFFEFQERRNRDRDTYENGAFRPSPFEILFEDEADSAEAIWTAARHANSTAGTVSRLRTIRQLLQGTADVVAEAEALRHLSEYQNHCRSLSGHALWTFAQAGRARAVIFQRRARLDLAEAALREAVAIVPLNLEGVGDHHETARNWVYNTNESYRLWVDLGDLILQQGRPRSAAEIYLQGWKQYPNNPVPLYHSGRALLLAGDAKEGERRISLSHQVAGAAVSIRGRFLDELLNRGRRQDLQHERDHLRNLIWRQEYSVGNVWSLLVRVNSVLGDHAAVARDAERYGNYVLSSSGVSFVDGRSYLDFPAMVPMSKAILAAKAGRVPEAMSLANEVLALLPGHPPLATALVPQLDAAGATSDADRLFHSIWKAHREVIDKYPDSGWACTAAASIAANCRRQLDTALADAERGVSLEPHSLWAREVLAEVLFRRGERAAAATIITKLAAESPRNYFFQRQIQRYAHGDLTSPLPVGPTE